MLVALLILFVLVCIACCIIYYIPLPPPLAAMPIKAILYVIVFVCAFIYVWQFLPRK